MQFNQILNFAHEMTLEIIKSIKHLFYRSTLLYLSRNTLSYLLKDILFI